MPKSATDNFLKKYLKRKSEGEGRLTNESITFVIKSTTPEELPPIEEPFPFQDIARILPPEFEKLPEEEIPSNPEAPVNPVPTPTEKKQPPNIFHPPSIDLPDTYNPIAVKWFTNSKLTEIKAEIKGVQETIKNIIKWLYQIERSLGGLINLSYSEFKFIFLYLKELNEIIRSIKRSIKPIAQEVATDLLAKAIEKITKELSNFIEARVQNLEDKLLGVQIETIKYIAQVRTSLQVRTEIINNRVTGLINALPRVITDSVSIMLRNIFGPLLGWIPMVIAFFEPINKNWKEFSELWDIFANHPETVVSLLRSIRPAEPKLELRRAVEEGFMEFFKAFPVEGITQDQIALIQTFTNWETLTNIIGELWD